MREKGGATLLVFLSLVFLTTFGCRAVYGLGMLIPERMSKVAVSRPPENFDDLEMVVVPRPQLQPLQISDQTIEVAVTDQVTRTKVDQKFYNASGHVLEGSFLFPLPSGSTISDFALYINGKRRPGEMLEAGKAKGIYEGIVRRMQDPALLEYVGDNLFKARVFPIPARGGRRVDLTYEQVLKLDDGLCRYVFPLRAPGNLSKPIKNFTLTMKIKSQRPIKTIYSPSHEIYIKRHGDNEVTIGFEAENLKCDRDFVLIYSVDEKSFGCSLLTHRPDPEDDGYFMLLLTPKQDRSTDEIIPKDVTFVLDTSGSMNGRKIEQAKKALLFCVNSLAVYDQFNVIGFSTDVDPLFDAPRRATGKNVESARRFIGKRLRARGGTAINDALLKALEHHPAAGRPYMVVFVTDGKPTVGPRDPDAIIANVSAAVKKGIRIFSIGVGDRINTKLLDRLSGTYRGTSVYIRPNEDIEIKMSSFYNKISSPVLADLKLDFGPVDITEIYPRKLPDLFAGSQIEVVGRYRGKGNIALKLSGSTRNKRVLLAYDAEFPSHEDSNDFLQRIWAQRKVGFLMDEIRLHGTNDELRSEIVRLGKKYCIETPYTSFLVVQDDEPRLVRRMPAPPPPGVWAREAAMSPRARKMETEVRYVNKGDSFMPSSLGLSPGIADKKAKAPGGSGGYFDSSHAARMKPMMDFEADTGATAVETARKLAGMKDAGVVKGVASSAVRMIGARTFYLRNGVWFDSEYRESLPAIDVKYGSDAYYTLLKTLKKIKACIVIGKNVRIVYMDRVLSISESKGREKISVSELKSFFSKN